MVILLSIHFNKIIYSLIDPANWKKPLICHIYHFIAFAPQWEFSIKCFGIHLSIYLQLLICNDSFLLRNICDFDRLT